MSEYTARKATVEEMVRAVRESNSPCTAADIADVVAVSRPTIHNHRDKLRQDPRIEYGDVGGAEAYWMASGHSQRPNTHHPTVLPGPNKSDSREAVKGTLADTDSRAMTAGMVADRVDYSRRTVHSRLTELADAGEIETEQIGQATAYWMPNNMSDTDTTTTDDSTEPTVETIADDIDPGDIWDTDHEDVGIYEYQRHRNGDVTVLLLCSFAEGWQAFACDIAEDGEVLETEVVGHAAEHSRALGMCEYWVQQHPKGLLGGTPDDDGGVLAGIKRLFGGEAT